MLSSRVQRGCGFTFEVQQFGEKDLGRGPELEALSRGVVVCREASLEDNVVDGVEVCLSGQEPAQSADGVLHGALLPRTVRVAKEGPDAELIGKGKVLGELGAVVEGNGPPQTPIERLEPGLELLDGGLRGLAGLAGSQDEARFALLRHEGGLAGGGEEHEVGFPVSEGAPTVDGGGPQGDGNTAFDEIVGRALAAPLRAALVLGSGQIVAPGAIVGAADLGVDEAVDALMADGGSSLLLLEPAGDLLGRPAARQAVEHEGAQRGIAFQARALPAAAACLLLGVGRLVADLAAAVALQLARQARWRAIQSCRDLADRLAGLVKLGNRAPLFEREVTIVFAHCNTLSWCCTSFVNSGGPFAMPDQGSLAMLGMTVVVCRLPCVGFRRCGRGAAPDRDRRKDRQHPRRRPKAAADPSDRASPALRCSPDAL